MSNASAYPSMEEPPPPPPSPELTEGEATTLSSPSQHLRQRRKSRRRLSYQIVTNDDDGDAKEERKTKLNETQESVFLNMYIRKMNRRVYGQYSNDSLCCEFVVVVILSAFIMAQGWDDADAGKGDWTNADTIGLSVVFVWVVFCFSLFFVLGDSPYVKMMRYMVIYIPLLFFLTSYSFYEETHDDDNVSITLLMQISLP